jgi:hypothetical protein
MSFLDNMRDILSSERRIIATQTEWTCAWRQLAELTDALTEDDCRFQPVMDALSQCDRAYLVGDWDDFEKAAARVRDAIYIEPHM